MAEFVIGWDLVWSFLPVASGMVVAIASIFGGAIIAIGAGMWLYALVSGHGRRHGG